MKEQLIVINAEGDIQTLYNDNLHALGRVHDVARASHVEPGPDGWDVVLTDEPRNGAWAGHVVGRGFGKRSDALAAEVAFINEHILGR